jgi:Mrp family chromosome partitioning ATPase
MTLDELAAAIALSYKSSSKPKPRKKKRKQATTSTSATVATSTITPSLAASASSSSSLSTSISTPPEGDNPGQNSDEKFIFAQSILITEVVDYGSWLKPAIEALGTIGTDND